MITIKSYVVIPKPLRLDSFKRPTKTNTN